MNATAEENGAAQLPSGNPPENQERSLLCPWHGRATVRMIESPDDDYHAQCPACAYRCPNYLKYPVAMVKELGSGRTYQMNVITGERPYPDENIRGG